MLTFYSILGGYLGFTVERHVDAWAMLAKRIFYLNFLLTRAKYYNFGVFS
jgi:hypothetical protein